MARLTDSRNGEGINCTCGTFTPYSAYVYAHAREVLIFTCPKCHRKWSVVNLTAAPVWPRKTDRL